MIPSYGTSLDGDVAATEQVLSSTSRILQLDYQAPESSAADPVSQPVPAANDEGHDTENVVGK